MKTILEKIEDETAFSTNPTELHIGKLEYEELVKDLTPFSVREKRQKARQKAGQEAAIGKVHTPKFPNGLKVIITNHRSYLRVV
jgi:hypothetical protein